MANGSRRSFPTAPAAAAVVSEAMIDPMKTPCCQLKASVINGTTVDRRPPKRTAEIGTPRGASHSAALEGSRDPGGGHRGFGWAAGVPVPGVQDWPFQSVR